MPRALCLVLFAAAAAQEVAPARLEYTVTIRQPASQTFDVALAIPDVREETLHVALPVWRPGKYVVLDPAGTVREVRASDGEGRALPLRKVKKSVWEIVPGGAARVVVRYRVFANSLGDRTRHLDDTHAFLSGSSVFMYPLSRRDQPSRIVVDAPSSWRIASGLASDPERPRALLAPDYDVLVDSPIEIGLHQLFAFEASGARHEIVVWGETEVDGPRLCRDFAKLVEHQRAIFGDLPYERYVFIIHVAPDIGGGTEHLNSTVMHVKPGTLSGGGGYESFLSLTSHELFHTWNVKQLRPAGIHPYDYLGENYTPLLWVSEGTTSYYQRLVMVRAGLLRADSYLRGLGDWISRYEGRPGSAVQSLEMSSFDAWIKFNKSTPDDWNSTVSFYRKGALVSLLLDMRLRAAGTSLDAVLRQLYERFPLSGPGFTTADLRAAIEELSGEDFASFFAAWVAGTAPLDFDALATVGVERVFRVSSGAIVDGPPPLKADLGVRLEDRVIDRLRSDGGALAAGLMLGDELVAIDGVRLTDLDDQIGEHAPGDTVRVSYFRRDRLRSVEVVLGGIPDGKWTLRRIRNATAAQKQAYRAWLGQAWPGS